MAKNVEVHILTGFLTIPRKDGELLDSLNSIDEKLREVIAESIPKGSFLIRVMRDLKSQNGEWNIMYTIYYV